jgi:hypothetical protein
MHGRYKYGTKPKVIFNASIRIFLNMYMQEKKNLQQAENVLIKIRISRLKCDRASRIENKQNQKDIT